MTGAADDDPSAIGTYASAGARFGTAALWLAPVMLPMMYTVVYLSSKLGQVSGRGLFHVIRDFYPRWLLWSVLVGVVIGNTIEAAADLGGMAAALGLFVPAPNALLVTGIALIVFAVQCLASYRTISKVLRWLALALLAYIGAAVLAKPDLTAILMGTFIPHIAFSPEFLSIVVAMVGTSLSAYIYTWQSNQEVEEQIADGKKTLSSRLGASREELRSTQRDVLAGMGFANIIMYCIMLSTAATLHANGQTSIDTAAQAAEALRPIAGDAAGILFALGIIGVGFLAVPVMTTGAAYDLAQAFGWKASLNARPRDARKFYLAIGAFTAAAVALNFLGFNPMKALVWSGIVQGFSTPPLLFLIMLMTNNRRIMGDKVNGGLTNFLGWTTTLAIFSATAGLIATWFL
ncbi:Nramp family divalent metal transporter [Oryzifoliimicrobium ureilyticus]|uniref:Nramp family divalent metal transporter n=1 Tax=Oryzifoliimicrobium ureilyticus TaxID=3113724 RepID=UPI00307669B1